MDMTYYIVRGFFDPLALLFLVFSAALFFLYRREKNLKPSSSFQVGRFLLAGGTFLLYALSVEPVARGLHYPLEKEFLPLRGVPAPQADYYVVLGGGVWDVEPGGVVPAFSSFLRVYRMVEAAQGTEGKIIFSGRGPKMSEAEVMADFAQKLGLDPKRILLEEKGRNTWDEAEEVARMIPADSRLVLVTSATHMKRSLLAFSCFFDDVSPMPSHFNTLDHGYVVRNILPSAKVFLSSSSALHEYIGLLWYLLKKKLR